MGIKKFRTVVSVIIMILCGIVDLFFGGAFKTWFAELSFEHREFTEGKTPGETLAGGNSYQFDVNNGALVFTYVDFGIGAYIVYDDEWYEIKNPKLPPVVEPVS